MSDRSTPNQRLLAGQFIVSNSLRRLYLVSVFFSSSTHGGYSSQAATYSGDSGG